MAAAKPVSLKEYARHLGVEPKAVRKAIQSGRITEGRSAVKTRGRWFIHVARADREWKKRTNPLYNAQQKARRTKARKEPPEEEPGLFGKVPTQPKLPRAATKDEDSTEDGVDNALVRGQADLKRIQAMRQQLAYEKEIGAVYRRPEIDAVLFAASRVVRDRLLTFETRLAKLAAISDPAKVKEFVSQEVRYVLEGMQVELRKIASEMQDESAA